MIEISCIECKNCTGYSCKKYGEDANESVNRCAKDGFKHYKKRDTKGGVKNG